jgi:hypothetical protein
MSILSLTQVHRRLQHLHGSANHQYYIRSHGRIAECYLIFNPNRPITPEGREHLRREHYIGNPEFTSRQLRRREVYGPRVIDMTTENGKYLLNWISGDISRHSSPEEKLPKYWSIFCGSIVEQPAFEIYMKEQPQSQVNPVGRCLFRCGGRLNDD